MTAINRHILYLCPVSRVLYNLHVNKFNYDDVSSVLQISCTIPLWFPAVIRFLTPFNPPRISVCKAYFSWQKKRVLNHSSYSCGSSCCHWWRLGYKLWWTNLSFTHANDEVRSYPQMHLKVAIWPSLQSHLMTNIRYGSKVNPIKCITSWTATNILLSARPCFRLHSRSGHDRN